MTTQHDDNTRRCDHCGKAMSEGYCLFAGEEYYCSDDCLHQHYSPEEWEEMYDDEGDSYWTEWESIHFDDSLPNSALPITDGEDIPFDAPTPVPSTPINPFEKYVLPSSTPLSTADDNELFQQVDDLLRSHFGLPSKPRF